MANEVEQIKERLSIAEVVSQYAKLEKAGANFKAKCPFHNEKTPSFFVSPARNSYYCFGCGAKGDIFSFVQAFEGLDFLGALTLLAARAGVALAPRDPKAEGEREKLFTVMEEAARFYERALTESAPARSYLAERGLSPATAGHFRVGFALPAWRALSEHLRARGFAERLLLLSGLVKEAKGRSYDRFRGRIMFPVSDASGRTVAFSGRLFGERPERKGAAEGEEAKYINSPETPLFSKSRTLYGFDKAKQVIHKYDFSIVVEGQMDLLLSHQSGFQNTVALSGTALTDEQVLMLFRLSGNVVLAFDADRAGILSSGRSASLALARGMDVKVAALPKGKDPADLVREDPEAWRRAIRESEHIVDYYLDVLAGAGHDLRTLRLKAREQVLPFIARIGNRIDQAHFISRVASRLNLAEEPVWEEVRKLSAAPTRETGTAAPAAAPPAALSPYSRADLIARKLKGILLLEERAAKPAVDTMALRARLTELLGDGLDAGSADAEDELLFEAEAAYERTEGISADTGELLRYLSIERARAELATATEALRRAEAARDEAGAREILGRVKKISADITELSAA